MTVPDHRLDEIMQKLRTFESENARLRGTVDALMQRPQQMQHEQAPEESPFQPEVERALQARFEREMSKRFAPIEQQTKQAIGALADQNDHLKFALKYGQDIYEKNQDKIERVREERSRTGQWVSREDAYRLVFFDENGKKPAVNPQAAQPAVPQAPAVDPYTGFMRESAVVDTPAMTNQQAAPLQLQVQQPPAVQHEQTALPMLPPQTVAPPAAQTQTQPQVPSKLDVDMTADQLSAWAGKYADIPL